jgi:hypothetical protein
VHFGNARTVNQLFEQMKNRLAERKFESLDRETSVAQTLEDLSTFSPVDVPEPVLLPKRRRVRLTTEPSPDGEVVPPAVVLDKETGDTGLPPPEQKKVRQNTKGHRPVHDP